MRCLSLVRRAARAARAPRFSFPLLPLSHSRSFSAIPGNMGMDHIGLTVPNCEEAAEFFIKMFGCRFDWEVKREAKPSAGERFIQHRTGPRSWTEVFGLHHDSSMAHVMMLKAGEHHLAQYIELFEFRAPDQLMLPGGWPKMSDIGFSYVSFTVKDAEAVLKHVKQVNWPGVRILQDPPMDFAMRGEVCKSFFIVAPWGMWIEITEWSESKKTGKVMPMSEDTRPSNFSFHASPSGAGDNHAFVVQHPDIGKTVNQLDTPCWFVDMKAMEHNVQLIRERTKAAGVSWRPPIKAHKCPDLAKKLLSAGANGVLALKVSEAEVFADAGIDDIMIANQVIGAEKISRLVELAKRCRLKVCVDDEDNLREIHSAALKAGVRLEVLVEVDVNHHRCGVSPEEAVELAQIATQLQNDDGGVLFAGLQGYEGHTPILAPPDKTRETQASHAILKKARELIESKGIKVKVVSGGGSSNYVDCLSPGVLTEVQAGGAALCDMLYSTKAHLSNHGHQNASFILSSVMSVPKDQSRAMGDAGFKALGWHPFGGLAAVRDRADIHLSGYSAEHCKIHPVAPNTTVNLKRGDKLVLVPGYGDAMGYGHKQIYAVRDGVVESVWPVLAAGMLQ